jgi:hypothetical protein
MASISASESQWSASEKVRVETFSQYVIHTLYISRKRIFEECYHRFMSMKSNQHSADFSLLAAFHSSMRPVVSRRGLSTCEKCQLDTQVITYE